MTQGMITGGWIFFVFGWGFIMALAFYCFRRVLFGKKTEVGRMNQKTVIKL